MSNIPELEYSCGSWVIVKKGTLEGVIEIFKQDRHIVEKINFDKYEALTALDYLSKLNQSIKELV